ALAACRVARKTHVDGLALGSRSVATVLRQGGERVGVHPRVSEDTRLGLAVLVDRLVTRKPRAREAGHPPFCHRLLPDCGPLPQRCPPANAPRGGSIDLPIPGC